MTSPDDNVKGNRVQPPAGGRDGSEPGLS